MTDIKQKPSFDAFSVEERGENQKPFYRNIGAAWETKSKNGYNLKLNVLPLDGRVLLLPYSEKPPKDEAKP